MSTANLANLPKRAADARTALEAAIVAERATGRSLESIATEVGMTKAGVYYLVRRHEAATGEVSQPSL